MTGRERSLTAIQGGMPDRVPAYTPTIASDVAGHILGREVHTGGPALWFAEARAWCDGPSAWQEFDCRVTEDIIDLHRALEQDIIRFPWRNNIRPTARLDEVTFRCGDLDKAHAIWRWDQETSNFLCVKRPERPRVEDWPHVARRVEEDLAGRLARIRESAGVREARLQARLGESMLVAAGGAGLSLGVDEASLMAAIQEPAAVEAILECDLVAGLEELRTLAGQGLKVVLGGGDMADKNGPIYSPAMFARFMLPRWKKVAACCRDLGLHYVWRSDGNLWKVADMLFREAGFVGFGEVDYDAAMTCARLRTAYPDVVIWGNLSGDLLRRGTAGQAYRHALESLQASGGRRYFHGCSNTILPGTPPGNVIAMMAARDDFSRQLAGS